MTPHPGDAWDALVGSPLFGIALTDGLILVSRFEHLRSGGMALRDTVVTGGRDRLRAVIMTTVTTAL